MHAVDTNVLVRLTVRDNQKQLAAARAFIVKGVWVSHIVICESLWVLTSYYGFTRAQQRDFLSGLLGNDLLSIHDREVVERALEKFNTHTKVSFSDCMILELARKNGCTPLGTFDAGLSKLEGARKL